MIHYSLHDKIEMKLYEFLGVKIFQKMVFGLEKIVHRKDGGTNENYHFRGERTKSSVADDFTKYLFYNGSIHVKNCVFISCWFLVKILILHSWNFGSWIMLILLIKDLYCVMLQRYNYLRIRTLKKMERVRYEKKKERFAKKLEAVSLENTFNQAELQLIRKLKSQLSENGVIKLEESDLLPLTNLRNLLY